MLDKIFWDYFKNTGSIDAYLASKDYDKFVQENYNNEQNEFPNNQKSNPLDSYDKNSLT